MNWEYEIADHREDAKRNDYSRFKENYAKYNSSYNWDQDTCNNLDCISNSSVNKLY